MKIGIILLLALTLISCTVEGIDGQQIPFWEITSELRNVKKCNTLLDLLRVNLDNAPDNKAKLKVYDEFDLTYALAGCGRLSKD